MHRVAVSEFAKFPDYFEVTINDSPELQGVRILSDTKAPEKKRILMPPDETIDAGSIVEWKGEKWIVVSVDRSKDEVYVKGFIEKCNSTLKWVDDRGQIQSFPCVFYYGTKANFGTFSDRVMTLPDGRRQVVVAKNEHTTKIKRNMRFMFGGNAFIVIDHDHVSEEGITNINLKDDQYNSATDNIELGIADYYEYVSNYTIEVLNGDNLSIEQTQKLQLSVQVLDNGIPIDNPQVQFLIEDENIAHIDENGLITAIAIGRVSISVIYENVRKTIDLNITDYIVNNYTVEILGSDEIKFSLSRVYTVAFKNNGVPIDETAQFRLTDSNNQQTKLAEIASSDKTSCTIKAGQSKSGSVTLHVQNENGLIKSSKEILIRSLL